MNGYNNGFVNKTSFGVGGAERERRERYGAKRKRRARAPRITAEAVYAVLVACEIILAVIFYDEVSAFLYASVVEPVAVTGSKVLLAVAGIGTVGGVLGKKIEKLKRKFF